MKIHYKILFSLIILLILAAGIGLAVDQTTYPTIPVNESDTSTTVVHIEFPFMDDVVVGDITIGLAPYYGAKQEGVKAIPLFGCSPEKYYSAIAYDPAQDQMYEKLFGLFDAYAKEHALTSDEYIELLTTYVQNIPYKTSGEEIKFPIETVIEDWGDCDDKSILLAGLLDKKEYDAGVFLFKNDNHMAAGIKGGYQTDYENSGYSIIETTRYAYIGEVPELLHQGSDHGDYSFYRIGNGTEVYTVSWQVSTILNVRDTAYAALEILYQGLSSLSATIETEKAMLATPEYASNTTLRSEYDLHLNEYNKGIIVGEKIRETLHMINSEPYNREKVYQTIQSMREEPVPGKVNI
jgi:hypothetical protein